MSWHRRYNKEVHDISSSILSLLKIDTLDGLYKCAGGEMNEHIEAYFDHADFIQFWPAHVLENSVSSNRACFDTHFVFDRNQGWKGMIQQMAIEAMRSDILAEMQLMCTNHLHC